MSLFTRFFFSIWLTTLLLIISLYGVLHLSGAINPNETRLEHWPQRGEAIRALNRISRVAAIRGKPAIQQWLEQAPNEAFRNVFAIDESGADIIGRRLPHEAQQAYLELGPERPTLSTVINDRPILVRQVYTRNGENIKIALIGPPSLESRFIGAITRYAWIPILLASLLSAVAAWLLARVMTQPIKDLRFATKLDYWQQGEKLLSVAKRNDELGALAKDFLKMSDNLDKSFKEQRGLISNISHELRTPLTRIQLNAELARTKSGEALDHHLNNIDSDVLQLSSIITDILALDSFGQHKLTRHCTTVESLIDASLEKSMLNATQDCIELQINHSDAQIELHGTLMEQALINVLNNALRHNGTSPIVIETQRKQAYIEIKVSDSGEGVPETELEMIFKPFYRSDTARSQHDGGVGLGLALTKKIVEYHDGSIRAENNRGLNVVIQLPLHH